MTMTNATEIKFHGITKTYGPFRALDSIDMSIAPGEFLTLLGPSGSGKSTLLMTLAGFVEPTDGNIFMGTRSLLGLAPEKRDFGVVFQGYALFPHMTVAENLAYPLKIRKIAKDEIKKQVQQTLDLVQLGHLAARYPKQLSGGQQQRVALARALVFSPNVLLLDEPMGALDKNLRHDLQIELRQLHRKLGRTFVNVTHDQEEAMAMSDRIAIMNGGRIIQIGDPRSLYEAPRSRFVASFLGKSNFIEGKVTDVSGNIATVETTDGSFLHKLKPDEASVVIGTGISLALRPQKIALGAGTNSVTGRVEGLVFLGTHAEFGVRTKAGQHLAVHAAVEAQLDLPREGDDVQVSWDPVSTVAIAAE